MSRRKEYCAYIYEIPQIPGRIKIGSSGDVQSRAKDLNLPGYIHKKICVCKCSSERAAKSLEARLHLLYSGCQVKDPGCNKREYFDVGIEEVRAIRDEAKYVLDKLRLAEKTSGPHTIEDCIAAGLVRVSITVYKTFKSRSGASGQGIESFLTEMSGYGSEVPLNVVKVNPCHGQAPWTGYVTVMPGASGFTSNLVKKELERINRGKKHGKKSRVKKMPRGSLKTTSCEAVRHVAPLIWPKRSPKKSHAFAA